MPKLKQKYKKALREINPQVPNVLQTNKKDLNQSNLKDRTESTSDDPVDVSSPLDDENCQPGTSSDASTSALYQELNSFRQRWRRELEESTKPKLESKATPNNERVATVDNVNDSIDLVESRSCDKLICDSDACKPSNPIEDERPAISETTDSNYAAAKRLFLIAVDLERDDMHHESISYYKKAMHLYPDIEKKIFRDQCEASIEDALLTQATPKEESTNLNVDCQQSDMSLYERILAGYQEDCTNHNFSHCRPQHKVKPGALHISDLPHELMSKIIRHIVGDELDLASLELTGMVCRGFYLLSQDKLLWKDVCLSTWGSKALSSSLKRGSTTDWRRMFLERPRVNFDGVYISRTRYFRQGDVGFQDITYRPFHVVRYYRYLRFFPDSRVLILTTNEEPEKIVPIFRHALNARQFSPELSIMEGKYEFLTDNQIYIMAEKKCRVLSSNNQSYRRQAQFHWSRQTPISQNFSLKFELKTVESKPYRNNVLKWLEYSIITSLETGQEVTSFDMNPDTFPNLIFSRVKRFNLRSANPLAIH